MSTDETAAPEPGDGATPARKPKRGAAGLLVAALVIGVVFGTGPLVRYLKAPAISESFGIEDAVVALRLDARDISYLVLVNEEGQTRSVRVEERGFENSKLAWSELGLSTGGPREEYLLHADGLSKFPVPDMPPSPSEQERIATDTGFTMLASSANGARAVFVDAANDSLTAVDAGYATPALAGCGDAALMVGERGVDEATPETRDFDRYGMFDDVEALACDGDRLFGLGGISDDARPREALRVWDRAGGAPREFEVRYPEAVNGWASTPFVSEGRLVWAADWKLWSIAVPELEAGSAADADGGAPVLEAVESADLGGSVGTDDPFAYDTVVGIDDGVLAPAAGRAYSVAADEEWVKRRRGGSYDKLNGLAVFSIDPRTGERRIEIEVDDIDFPRRDLHVHAIAVDPEWAAGR